MERQRAPPKGREAKNGSRGIDFRGRIPERLYRCRGRYLFSKEMLIMNDYYFNTKEREKNHDTDFRIVRRDR